MMDSNSDFKNPHHASSSEYRNRYYCIAIGSLIGIFIQFSSLCSNTQDFYAVPIAARPSLSDDTTGTTEEDDIHHIPSLLRNHTIQSESSPWNIGWSIVTTTMGIILLLTLRAIVLIVLKSSNTHPNALLESKLVHIRNMEHSVATGTLWGVSIAWIITDSILGLAIPQLSSSSTDTTSSFWYVPTLVSGVALLAWHMVVQWVVHIPTTSNDENQIDEMVRNDPEPQLRTPLLPHVEPQTHEPPAAFQTTSMIHPTTSQRRMIQLLSFGAGMMIGIFIQCSTFGITYVEQFVSYSRSTILTASTKDDPTSLLPQDFSFRIHEGMTIGISFVMSCFGLMLLLHIHAFIASCMKNGVDDANGKTSSKAAKPSKTTSNASSSSSSLYIQHCPLQTFVLTHIEMYLVTGTVAGLNIAWMVTDYTLFLLPQSLYSQSLQQPLLPYRFNSNYWYQSILTLVVSTLWCPLLLYCTGFFSKQPKHDSENNHDDNEKIMHSPLRDNVSSCSNNALPTSMAATIAPIEQCDITISLTSMSCTDNDEEMAYM
jgi:hypothetical protein